MAIKINRKPIILKKKENTEVIIPEKNDIEDILKLIITNWKIFQMMIKIN